MVMTTRRALALALGLALAACASGPTQAKSGPGPWHYGIVATNFWVGQVISPAPDGSQEISAYDDNWEANYGGCDGVLDAKARCQFEHRTADNGYFPTRMTPKQNPFYLDLPLADASLKNRWVQLQKDGHDCYGQIEDAGPAVYDDAAYVLGDARPRNTRFNGAGLDVSPALNGCLAFTGPVDGASDRVDWRFVDASDVPAGPWTRIITQ
jgi:hypothetical protein